MQLTIKDKNRQLCWGLGALESLCDELGIALQELDVAIMTNELSIMNKLTYAALKNGAEINDDSLDFNYKFFLNWLDNEPQQLGDDITSDFMKSKVQGVTMQKRYEEMIARMSDTAVDETAASSKKKSTRSAKS